MACSNPRNTYLLSAPPSAAADNDIYVAEAYGQIRALRPDGSEQWRYSLADDLAHSDADASRDIRIEYLVARSGGNLFGIATRESGSNVGSTILFALQGNHLSWQIPVPYPEQEASPIAIGATAIYEAGNDGVLRAYSRSDGRKLWEYQVSETAPGSPTVAADDSIYITGPRGNLHSIGPDGKQRWVLPSSLK